MAIKASLLSVLLLFALCMPLFSKLAATAPIPAIVASSFDAGKDVLNSTSEFTARGVIKAPYTSCGFPGASCAFADGSDQDSASDNIADDGYILSEVGNIDAADSSELVARGVIKAPYTSCGFPGASCAVGVPVVEDPDNATTANTDIPVDVTPVSNEDDEQNIVARGVIKAPYTSCGFPGASCAVYVDVDDDDKALFASDLSDA